MATYIVMYNYSDKGIENIKSSPDRLDAAKKAFSGTGVSIKDFYLSIGRYDGVAVCEAPDDKAIAQVLLRIGSLGYIRTETLSAFPEDEYRNIISGL